MRFLVDASLPRSATALLRQLGHDAADVRDNATAPQVVNLLETFVRREDWLAKLRRRLAIVEIWRVRFRPA